jgi:23S rRNA (guanosine2251-2'-O)-methyltransferase
MKRRSPSYRPTAPARVRKEREEIEYIYGKNAVYEAIKARPDIISELYIAPGFADEGYLDDVIAGTTASIKPLNLNNPPRGISRLAPHQGIVAAIVPQRLMRPYADFLRTLRVLPDTALLVLGEVQDPHNVGAMIRSAAAFGLAGVLIPPHNQAPVTGTVVKVSAGMAFRIPLVAIGNVNTTLRDLKDRGFWTYGLDGNGTVTTPTAQFTHPTVFVVGNEGEGLREKTRELCDEALSIPIHPRCESLNAAAATAIVLATWSAQHPTALVAGELPVVH